MWSFLINVGEHGNLFPGDPPLDLVPYSCFGVTSAFDVVLAMHMYKQVWLGQKHAYISSIFLF